MPRATKEELEWAYVLTREKFLATWERNNNPDFNEVAFEKLVVEAKTPQFT